MLGWNNLTVVCQFDNKRDALYKKKIVWIQFSARVGELIVRYTIQISIEVALSRVAQFKFQAPHPG